MKKLIKPSRVSGRCNAPASKSFMQRAVAAALLSEGTSTLHSLSHCDDCLASVDIARRLGAKITEMNDSLMIKGGLAPLDNEVSCGESGLCMRMFSPIVSLIDKEITISGKGSLLKRPVSMIEQPLKNLGVKKIETNKGFLPIKVTGPLLGGECTLDGSLSSQQITGLLMALPLVEQNTHLKVNNLKSKPYIDMTLELLNDFGIKIENHNYKDFYIPANQKYQACEYTIEGDWSGASFLISAAAVAGDIQIKGLNENSTQADREILKVLDRIGCQWGFEQGILYVRKKNLHPFVFDATDCPDLFPPLVAIAANCEGVSKIKGIKRLQHKESNRALVLRQEFEKMGISITLEEDEMLIEGATVQGCKIDSHNDHRIAMTAAVSALNADAAIEIMGAECINKSYPDFFEVFENLSL